MNTLRLNDYLGWFQLTVRTHLGAVSHGRGEGTFAETGLLAGWDVKRDLAMHVYISYLPHTFYMEISLPERFLQNPVPLYRDDIMLTFQIVLGEMVPGDMSLVLYSSIYM